MKQLQNQLNNKFTLFLTSRVWNLALFIILIILMIPRTILPEYDFLFGISIKFVFWVIGIDLLLCTILHYHYLSKPVLVIHVGFLFILSTSLLHLLGYIATVNIHEGKSTAIAFRWDKGKDLPLGFDLTVERIEREWYPIEVKIGVLNRGVKSGLYETRTGETITVDGYRIKVDQLNPLTTELLLTILDTGGQEIGKFSTLNEGLSLPQSFPLSFKLVAYKDQDLKRIWAQLKVSRGNTSLVTGISEVNSPLVWNEEGLRFYLTQTALDDKGQPYAGIQIVKDPSVPFVYAGFGILTSGFVWYFLAWWRKAKKLRGHI